MIINFKSYWQLLTRTRYSVNESKFAFFVAISDTAQRLPVHCVKVLWKKMAKCEAIVGQSWGKGGTNVQLKLDKNAIKFCTK